MNTTDQIDFSRPFMPEELTPFFFTKAYATLTEPQRTRYNQINALYFNEQTMFFEVSLAHTVLGYFLAQPDLPGDLKAGVRQFLAEEEEHSGMFRQLNRRCAPQWYAERDFHFIRVPPLGKAVLGAMSKRPHRFPFLLWLMHLHEERALFFGKAFLKYQDSLEPHFVAAQRKHLADEIGHVRWDEALLDWLWPRTGALGRRINIAIFSWMMREYFTVPKRTALRVVATLVEEFPELRPRHPEFRRQLRALGEDMEYRRSLYCAENVPLTFRRFDVCPEFHAMTAALPGYIPGGNA
ncbi:MAG TPA: diiron oxygenase [Chthoniobacteraceae bacterium]|nr:diiron oxygenase [Chthoniobacteraceae bacterium]